MNNVTTTTANDLANVSDEVLAYLAELDKKATARPIGWAYFPELRVVASDKVSEDVGKVKGSFILITKDADGNKKMSPIESPVHAVILKVTNQYNIYDEVEAKTTYITNEFERWDTIALKNAEWATLFKWTQSELKAWALVHLPDPKSKPDYPKHLLRFKFVHYILIPSLFNPENPVWSVFRLYSSVSSLDNHKAYDSSLKWAPIRYITEITTEKKDNWWVRFYPICMKTVWEVPMSELMPYLNIKRELDEALKNINLDFINDSPLQVETWPALPSPTRPATATPTPAYKAAPVYEAPIVDTVSEDDVNSIFG